MNKAKTKSNNNPNSENKVEFKRGNTTSTDTKMTSCKSKFFTPIDGTSEYADYQEIKLQELFKTLKPGLIPRSMCVIL